MRSADSLFRDLMYNGTCAIVPGKHWVPVPPNLLKYSRGITGTWVNERAGCADWAGKYYWGVSMFGEP